MTDKNPKTDFARWQAPEVDDSRHLTPEDIEEARKLAWDQGYQDGYASGLEAGSAEVTRNVQHLDEVLDTLARPFADLDSAVSEALVALVIAVAGQLVRREIKIDPSHVISVVREGLAALPVAERNIRIIVHPLDAELIRNRLDLDESEQAWSLQPDPMMERGSCEVIAESAQIDGRLETRLRRLVAKMIHDGREGYSV
ncbi:MAG: flagellar assembly protein FliH [Gammaproteobacteria bacterium]|jgi:flagellar assembly protein FliH